MLNYDALDQQFDSMNPHDNIAYPSHYHGGGSHGFQHKPIGHRMGGFGHHRPMQDSFRSDDPNNSSSSFVNYRQKEDGEADGDLMGDNLRKKKVGGRALGGVGNAEVIGSRHEMIIHPPMSEEEKSQKQDKYLEMMISDIERKVINDYHAQALQALLDMGYINYENNKFCIVLGYTIDSTIHYHDCRDCQTRLKGNPYPSYPGKPMQPSQMAAEKQNNMYWDDPTLTYQQRVSLIPDASHRMIMGKLYTQGYLDFEENYKVVHRDQSGDLNTIIAQLDR